MKYYIPMHKSNYSDFDIADMIYPTNIQHHYSPQTYWEPGEDYIDYDCELDKDFNKVVQIAEFYYYDEDYPFSVIIDGNTYCLGEKEGWEEVIEHLGWVFFEDLAMKEDLSDVEWDLKDWIDNIANKKAWDIVNNE